MSGLRDALKALKSAVLESSDDDAELSPEHALLHISLISLRQLETAARDADDSDCADAAKSARKELKRFRSEAASTAPATTAGVKHARTETEDHSTSSASASPGTGESAHLQLGQYATTDAFDGNDRKKNKFARLLGGGKASAGDQPRNTVVASSASVKEMNRVLENQYEDALRRGKKKGLGA